MEKMRFEGKVVIVTGASSGIGRSTARLFAMEGAKVVAAARRLKRQWRSCQLPSLLSASARRPCSCAG